jgi:FtsH-binding integral membrane protein
MPDDKATIREFVEENDKLLAVLGIFLGVAAFTVNAQIRLVGQIVAFLFILAALLIWSELFFRFKRSKPPHRRLVFFYIILTLAFLTTILYWMLEFTNIMRFALAAIIFQTAYIHIKPEREKQDTKFVRFFVWFGFWVIAIVISANMNKGLDRFRNYLLSKQETISSKP